MHKTTKHYLKSAYPFLYMETAEEESAAVMEETSNSLLRNTRCYFCFPCFNSRQSSTVGLSWWERIQSQNRWWSPAVTAFQRVRDWSEIVAGPKWKTFIRRFNRNRSNNNSTHAHGHGRFQYDPLSYSLNFEENGNYEHNDDFNGFRNFSTRYASSKSAAAAAATIPVDVRGKDVAALA